MKHPKKAVPSFDWAKGFEAIRQEKGLTKKVFLKLAGLTPYAYEDILKGKAVDAQWLEEICINLDVPLEILLVKARNLATIQDKSTREVFTWIQQVLKKISHTKKLS